MSATVLAGIPAVSSELIDEPREEMGDWELLYQVDGVPDGSHPFYPDLTVYGIERQHFLGNNWRIRYWIYNTQELEFTATFTDEVTLDDDEDWWHIDYTTHNSELMVYGINGPYYTRWFPAPYKGYFDCNVYLDIFDDVEEGPGEGNNWDYITALFWWLF